MYWAESGFGGGVRFDPEIRRSWCLCIYEAPIAEAERHLDHALAVPPADRRDPRRSTPRRAASIPTMHARLIEAQARGFDNCLMRDMLGNIAELGNVNVFMAKDDVVFTPAPNGTFLDGITRQRVIKPVA